MTDATTPTIDLDALAVHLDALYIDASDLGLLAADLKRKIEALRQRLAPTDASEPFDLAADTPSRLYFG